MKKIRDFIFKLTPLRISMIITFGILLYMFPQTKYSMPAYQLLELFEFKVFDFRLQLRGEERTGDKVVLVAIDEKTLDTLGRWPFSRTRMADAIRNMDDDGAKVIAWDVLFAEEDKNSELVKMRELRAQLEAQGLRGQAGSKPVGLVGDTVEDIATLRASLASLKSRMSPNDRRRLASTIRSLEERINSAQDKVTNLSAKQGQFYTEIVLGEERANTDRYFADTISATPNTILGYFFHGDRTDIGHLDPEGAAGRESMIAPSRISIVRSRFEMERLPGQPYIDVEPNIELYSKSTPHFGSFTIAQDSDGTIRNYPLVVNFNNQSFYPSLALKSIELYQDAPAMLSIGGTPNFPEIEEIRVGDLQIPASENGMVLINYRGGQGRFKTVSFSDVVLNEFPEGLFKDKIALIGPTAIGIMDLRVTPFDERMPGVEVHANVMDNILEQDFYQKPNWMTAFDVIAILALGILLGAFLAPLSSITIGIVVTGFIFIYLFGGQWLLVEQGVWLTTVYPLLEIMAVSGGVLVYKYYTEEREKKAIRGAFQFYLSPQVVDEVVDNPDKLRLGGERREITVMFSDIRSFTTISESLDAEELSTLLNEYLTPMTDVIYELRGTLDKYMGDAIMAFFGAPLEQPDHALRGCNAALGMMRELRRLQPEWDARGYPKIEHGMGVNTGIASVGNMGSEQRFDYTIMGDTVNLGARAESINKQYRTNIIITEFTYAACKEDIFCHSLDLVQVKGKSEPVKLYNLLANKPADTPLAAAAGMFDEAFALYQKGDFRVAFEGFQAITREYPDLGPAHVFVERSRDLIANPPEGEWDGVFVATSK